MQNKKILTVCYSHSGYTSFIAKNIRSSAGGDIFNIEMQKPYCKSYVGTLFCGGFDLLTGRKTALKNSIDISSYDIIFAGGPVWFFTVPPPLMTFLKNNNFSGKTLIPFCTQGNKEGKFFEKFAKNSNGAKILPGIDFSSKEFKSPDEITNKLSKWVEETLKQI